MALKILIVITGLGVGGAERLVTGLADTFVAAGHDVTLVYLHGRPVIVPKSTEVKLLGLRISKNPIRVMAGLLRLRKIIKELRPDVVSTHMFHANLFGRLLRLLTEVPKLVSSSHNTNEGGWLRMLVYRITDSLADISTNVSEEAVRSFEKKRAVPAGRMLVLHNGIDVDSFSYDDHARHQIRESLGIPHSRLVVLACGRINEQKDYPNLLRAVSGFTNKHGSLSLFIAGDGPLRRSMENYTTELGIDEQVCFLGVRHDVPALMSACDIFVLSSAWEGFGLVVAEAMACKRVVVATDCGGVREVVGSAGYLVPPKDSLALQYAVEQAASLSLYDARLMGNAARARVESLYSIRAASQKWLRLFSDN